LDGIGPILYPPRPSTAKLPSRDLRSVAMTRASNHAYRLGAALAAMGLLLAIGVVLAALASFSFSSNAARVTSVEGFHLALPSANLAAIALLALATIGVGVLLAVARGVWVIARAHRRLRREL